VNVLVPGGAGFIGSHCCLDLVTHRGGVIIVDDQSSSFPAALDPVEESAGVGLPRYQVDIGDRQALDQVFRAHELDAVIHFAGRSWWAQRDIHGVCRDTWCQRSNPTGYQIPDLPPRRQWVGVGS
jgi:UDP-glucose 4-epimerase